MSRRKVGGWWSVAGNSSCHCVRCYVTEQCEDGDCAIENPGREAQPYVNECALIDWLCIEHSAGRAPLSVSRLVQWRLTGEVTGEVYDRWLPNTVERRGSVK